MALFNIYLGIESRKHYNHTIDVQYYRQLCDIPPKETTPSVDVGINETLAMLP